MITADALWDVDRRSCPLPMPTGHYVIEQPRITRMIRKTMMMIVMAAAAGASNVQAQDFDPMPMADTDGNGNVTMEEYATFRETGWGFFAQGSASVKVIDLPPAAAGAFRGMTPDTSGVVTHAAYTQAGAARFQDADKNGDGVLDAAELRSTM